MPHRSDPSTGRRSPRKKGEPGLAKELEAIIEPETAGDPTSETKWTRSSLKSLSGRLSAKGYRISAPTVRRLLKERHFSLRSLRKAKERASATSERNRQFLYIQLHRSAFKAAGWPVISVDTKNKELIGAFKKAGQTWRREAVEVNVHDFPQEALGKAVPYGVFDTIQNQGAVYVGDSSDTPRFAVDAIVRWWKTEGSVRYPEAPHLLILADSGGSNGCRPRAWKLHLQEKLCDAFGLTVTICHYPTGCSKYNPIEHRLFGPISVNWAGEVLSSFEVMMAYVRGTTNETGLEVTATRMEGTYEIGEKVSKEQMAELCLDRHFVCPPWNYTLHPRMRLPPALYLSPTLPELIS